MEIIDTKNIPSYAIPYIEYGEQDGLTDEDIRNIDVFLARYPGAYFDYTDDEDFSASPAFGLPTQCVVTNIWK